MDLKKHDEELEQQKPPVSVLQGDGFCMSKILSRDCSLGQSSRIYYRSAEGNIPLKWESQPGMPKINLHEEDNDVIPPPSPSPLMQSLGLPLPHVLCYNDHDDDGVPQGRSRCKIWSFKALLVKRSKQHRSSQRFRSSPSAASSSLSSSSSSTSSSKNPVLDSSAAVDVPFSCSPWTVPAVLVRVVRRV